MLGQSRHGHYRASDGNHKTRPGQQPDFPYCQGPTTGRAFKGRVIREGHLRFGDADRKPGISQFSEAIQGSLRFLGIINPGGAIDLGGDGLDLGPEG